MAVTWQGNFLEVVHVRDHMFYDQNIDAYWIFSNDYDFQASDLVGRESFVGPELVAGRLLHPDQQHAESPRKVNLFNGVQYISPFNATKSSLGLREQYFPHDILK